MHGNLLASVTPVDDNAFLIYDASDSNDPKRVLGSVLKTYIGAGLPTGNTSANVLVADGCGVFQSVALSGDATISNVGALTLASNSVGSAQIEANAVTASKLDINGVSLLSGTVVAGDEVLMYDASTTSNVKAPMSALSTFVSANLTVGSVSSVKIVDGAVTTAKVADANITTAKLADANVT